MATHKSFCRFCHAFCGIEVDVEDGVAVKVRGDRDNPMSQGFSCIKGRSLPDQHEHEDRLRESLARGADGTLAPIGAGSAMDEIAQKLAAIIERDGPRAVALYAGTAAYQSSVTLPVARAWIGGLGSPSYYSSLSIDQPNKIVGPQLHGSFLAGSQSFVSSDVWMVFGCNSIVSLYGGVSGFPSFNPTRRIRDAIDAGLDLIVVDPRRSEVARMGSLHLPVRPGEDASLLAGMLRVILEEELYDADFCGRFTNGLAELREALKGFEREFVERRTGLDWSLIEEAARRFAAGPRGCASSGTGPSMAPNPNLTEHLILCLNSLCGRYNRVGDEVANPGTLTPPRPYVEEAMSPFAGFRMEPQSRIRGLGQVAGELPTAALADEILTPGDGQVRALVVVGGNPLLSWPDQLKTERALESLELLVVIDPHLTATAQLADYVIAPSLCLERPDITALMDIWFPEPFAMYTPALLEKPEGTLADWEFLCGLAKRLGSGILLPGGPVDLEAELSADTLLESLTTHSRIGLQELKRHPAGAVFNDPPVRVEAGKPDSVGRMQLMPEELKGELAELAGEPAVSGAGYRPGERFSHRLISRRMREVFNSMGHDLPEVRKRRQYNPAYMNPADVADLGVAKGATLEIDSGHGQILAVVEPTEDVPPGVISMAHAWGAAPSREAPVRTVGSCTSRLVDAECEYDPISGMARQSAIPVNVRPAAGKGAGQA
jgi:anaerobic selenocysteine-containing dehydrogenase